jgi:hypothetical protein
MGKGKYVSEIDSTNVNDEIGNVLAAAAREKDFELSNVDRINLLRAGGDEWVMRIVDRDGEFESTILKVKPDAGAPAGPSAARSGTSEGVGA